MPYIKQRQRESLQPLLEQIGEKLFEYCYDEGVINYLVTQMLTGYVWFHGKKYKVLSHARGIVQDVSDEFYRRVVVPYEQEKCETNGDVY